MVGTRVASVRAEPADAKRPISAASRAPSVALRALVAKSRYETPKVVSFPIDGMDLSPTTMAGNL
jgi:hypothetical protein